MGTKPRRGAFSTEGDVKTHITGDEKVAMGRNRVNSYLLYGGGKSRMAFSDGTDCDSSGKRLNALALQF